MSAGPVHPHGNEAPSPWVVRFGTLVAPGARVLDVASGQGRHARWFAARGVNVVAVDRDAQALASLAGVERVEARVADIEAADWPLARERFDAVIVTNYLHRPLFPALIAALAHDGVLIYETFAQGNERYGRPANPAFLLAPDELLERLRPTLRVVAFEQGRVDGSARTTVVQRIAAVGPGRPWPPRLANAGASK